MRALFITLPVTLSLLICASACDSQDVAPASPGWSGHPAALADPPAFSLSSALMSIPEGESRVVTVRLDAPAAADVRMGVRSADRVRLSVPGALFFKKGEQALKIQLTSIPDEDVDDNEVVVEVGGGYTWEKLRVQISDRGQQGLRMDPQHPTLREGESTKVVVKLTRRPQQQLTVAVRVSDPVRVTVSPPSLTITPDDYDQLRTITLQANPDADADPNDVRFSLQAAGLPPLERLLTIEDKDDQGFTVELLRDTPDGTSQPLVFGLERAPTEPVVVRISGTPGVTVTDGGAPINEVTLDGTNYQKSERGQVTSAVDADLIDTPAHLFLVTGGSERMLSFVGRDLDVQKVEVEGQVHQLTRNMVKGVPDTLSLRLKKRPQKDVTVSLDANTVNADDAAPEVFFTPKELVFTQNNWDAPQKVHVYPRKDGGKVTLKTVATGDKPASPTEVTVNVVETMPDVVLPALSLQLHPGQVYEMPLSFAEAKQRELKVANDNAACVTAADTVAFSSSSASEDLQLTGAGRDCEAKLTITGVGAGAEVTLTVKVSDVPASSPKIFAPPALRIQEGKTQELSFSLSKEPTAAVKVEATSDALQVAPRQRKVADTAAQTFVLTAPEDADSADQTVQLRLTAPGYSPATVRVTIEDKDRQKIQLWPAALTLTEGQPGVQQLRLAQRPQAELTVKVEAPAGLTAEPTQLRFSPENYREYQTVTLTPAEVSQDTSLALLYAAPTAFATADITVKDAAAPTAPALVVSTHHLRVREGDAASLTLRLVGGDGPVEVTVANPADAKLRVNPAGPVQLGASPVTLTLTGLDDPDLADERLNLSLSSSAGDDTVEVLVEDDDLAKLALVAIDDITGKKETDAPFTVSVGLNFSPTAPVLVRVFVSGGGATVSPSAVELTDSAAKELRVTPINDADTEDARLTVTLKAAGLTDEVFTVALEDQTTQGLDVQLTDNEATEGSATDMAELTVALKAPPAGEKTVSLSLEPTTAPAGMATTELRFDRTSWNKPQTVTVSATEDSDDADNTVRVKVSMPGADAVTTGDITLKEAKQLPKLYVRSSRDLNDRARKRLYHNQVYHIYQGKFETSGQWNDGMICVNAETRPDDPVVLSVRLKIVEGECREGLEIDDGFTVVTRTNYDQASDSSSDFSNCVKIKCSDYGRLLVRARVTPWSGGSTAPLDAYFHSTEDGRGHWAFGHRLGKQLAWAPIDYYTGHGLAYPVQEGGPYLNMYLLVSSSANPSCRVDAGPLEISCDKGQTYGGSCAMPQFQPYLRVRARPNSASAVTSARVRCTGTYWGVTRGASINFLVQPRELLTNHAVYAQPATAPANPSDRPYRALAYSYVGDPELHGQVYLYWRDGGPSMKLGKIALRDLSGAEELILKDVKTMQGYSNDHPNCSAPWDSLFVFLWYGRNNVPDPASVRPAVLLGRCQGSGAMYRSGTGGDSSFPFTWVQGTDAAYTGHGKFYYLANNSLNDLRPAYYYNERTSNQWAGYAGASDLKVAEDPDGDDRLVFYKQSGATYCRQIHYSQPKTPRSVAIEGDYRVASSPNAAVILTREDNTIRLHTIGYDCGGLKEIGSWTPPAGTTVEVGDFSVAGNGAEALALVTTRTSGQRRLVALRASMDNASSVAIQSVALATDGHRASAAWAVDRWVVSYFTGAGADGRMHVLSGSLDNIPAALTTP